MSSACSALPADVEYGSVLLAGPVLLVFMLVVMPVIAGVDDCMGTALVLLAPEAAIRVDKLPAPAAAPSLDVSLGSIAAADVAAVAASADPAMYIWKQYLLDNREAACYGDKLLC